MRTVVALDEAFDSADVNNDALNFYELGRHEIVPN